MRRWFQQKPWTLSGLGLFCVALAAWPWRMKIAAWTPPCMFRHYTNLNCPGCGGTRCVMALGEGRFLTALHMNPLAVALFVLLGFLWMRMVLREWREPPPRPLDLPESSGWLALVVVIGFSVLRNLPWWPFTLLVPS